MSIQNVRLEVMQFLEKKIDHFMEEFLIPVEKIWQPTDLLPNSQNETFFDDVKELREIAKDLPYDFWVTLVGDTITEEALPTYESWLMNVEGVGQEGQNGWSKWIRQWTGEENRHGDVLNKYLYLSGRVNMREIEMTTQHLINDGFDIGTSNDPYKNFVYTSFQELATYVSHNRVAQIAKKYGFHDLTHEWIRTHHVEQFDQVDTPAYLVHSWMKYPKFGHASATDYSARMVRYGMLTREEAIQLVKKHDHDLDPRSVREFCQFFGYSEKEFWEIIDSNYNQDIFEKKNNSVWEIKNPIWKEKK